MIILNFKTYQESTGKNAVGIARICKEVAARYNVEIVVAPQHTDLREVSEIGIPVLAQHIDPIEPGAHTGYVSGLAVKEAGAIGVLISHSEHPLTMEQITQTIAAAKSAGLKSLCFAGNVNDAQTIAGFGPDVLIYEPPELVGSGISVSQTKPEVIKKTVQRVARINPRLPVLCGAGIATREDVEKALALGTKGVALASAFVKAKNPRIILEELAKGMKDR